MSAARSLALAAGSGVLLLLALARPTVTAGPPATSSARRTTSHQAAVPPSGSATMSEPQIAIDRDGGVARCTIPDRGQGPYGPWQRSDIASMVVPEPPPTDRFDLMLHFHGGDAARRVVAPAALDLVIAAVDAGNGSKRYAETFWGPEPLESILAEVERKLAPAKLDRFIITSWSAGYGAVRELLRHHPERPDAVVLLDSLHASYLDKGAATNELARAGLEPFLNLAHRAVEGELVMVLTHSEIRPPNYASTSEVASWLIGELDGRRRYGGLLPAHGVELKTRFDRGKLHIRGYTGTGKPAHCAHLMLLADILRDDVLPALR